MDVHEFIELLRKSGSRFLSAMADSLEGAVDKASPSARSLLGIGEVMPLKNKMERFLSGALATMEHDGELVLLTSSIPLLHHVEARRRAKDRNSVVRLIGRSAKHTRMLKSRNPALVRTWDLLSNRPHEIRLDSKWRLVGWIVVTGDNIDLLGEAVNSILRKGAHGEGDI